MKWSESPEVHESIRNYLINQKEDLGNLLNSLSPYQDGSPPFQFLKVWGMFVFRYCENMRKHTELDAWNLTIAEISNDPTVQGMVAKIVSNQINGGLNIE